MSKKSTYAILIKTLNVAIYKSEQFLTVTVTNLHACNLINNIPVIGCVQLVGDIMCFMLPVSDWLGQLLSNIYLVLVGQSGSDQNIVICEIPKRHKTLINNISGKQNVSILMWKYVSQSFQNTFILQLLKSLSLRIHPHLHINYDNTNQLHSNQMYLSTFN